MLKIYQSLCRFKGLRISNRMRYARPLFGLFAILIVCGAGQASAQECRSSALARASFEKIYVPAYSHVLTHEGISQPLASTMVIHNVDPEVEIVVTSVEYLDRNGTRLKSFIEEPPTLGPFGSQSFLIPINEQAGGFGANYILEWTSTESALPPIVEAVMMGGGGTHGISFTSMGRVIACRP